MKSLKISKAKPNPLGKDWYEVDIPAAQLAAEWVEFKNEGNESFNLSNIGLYHKTRSGEFKLVYLFNRVLGVGLTIRVHSGGGPESVLRPIDKEGAEINVFTGNTYVWNNDIGDEPGLWNRSNSVWVDSTYYDPYPPEGAILFRLGGKLVRR